MALVDITIYSWSKRAFKTHQLEEYRNRHKVGLTTRSVEERVSETDTTGIDEPLLTERSWPVQVPEKYKAEFDGVVREECVNLGAKIARVDKSREFIIVPGLTEYDQMALIDRGVSAALARVNGTTSFSLNSINLKDHQQKAFDQLVQKTLGWYQMATGGGKTYTALALLEYHRTCNMADVVLVPGIELANQLSADIAFNTVCGRGVQELHLTIVHSGNASQLDDKLRERVVSNFGPSVDPIDISENLKRAEKSWKVLVVVNDSIETAAEALFLAGLSVNTKYIDELHRTATVGLNKNSKALYLKCVRQYGGTASQRNIRI